jgi:hypothetical protein
MRSARAGADPLGSTLNAWMHDAHIAATNAAHIARIAEAKAKAVSPVWYYSDEGLVFGDKSHPFLAFDEGGHEFLANVGGTLEGFFGGFGNWAESTVFSDPTRDIVDLAFQIHSKGLAKVVKMTWSEFLHSYTDIASTKSSYAAGESAFTWFSTVGGLFVGEDAGWEAGGRRIPGKRLEFSHWIPNRYLKRINSKWAVKKFGLSKWNGNYVTKTRHYLHDPKRFLVGYSEKKLPNRYHPIVQQLDRVPRVYYGTVSGGLLGSYVGITGGPSKKRER